MDSRETDPAGGERELRRQLSECRTAYRDRTDQFRRLLSQAREMTGNLRRNFEGMVNLLADILSQASPEMGGHAKRVAALSRSIAFALRLNPDRRRLVYYAASLHDLSLIGREKEWSAGDGSSWRLHPESSARQIATVENLSRIAEVIRCHHELYDGSGFPRGLSGEKIPLESRILAATVAWDRQTVIGGGDPAGVFDSLAASGGYDQQVLEKLHSIDETARSARERGDRLVSPAELVPGMMLAGDILLESGLVLYPAETVIDEENLNRIGSFAPMLAAERLIRVYRR